MRVQRCELQHLQARCSEMNGLPRPVPFAVRVSGHSVCSALDSGRKNGRKIDGRKMPQSEHKCRSVLPPLPPHMPYASRRLLGWGAAATADGWVICSYFFILSEESATAFCSCLKEK